MIYPDTSGRLPKTNERLQDKHSILSYVKDGVRTIVRLTKEKNTRGSKLLTDFKERFFAKAIEERGIDFDNITEEQLDGLAYLYTSNIKEIKRVVKSKRRDDKESAKIFEETKEYKSKNAGEQLMPYTTEELADENFNILRGDKFADQLAFDVTRNMPLAKMKEYVQNNRDGSYYRYFETFYKWYLRNVNDFKTMEAGMHKYIELLKTGGLNSK